MKKIQVETYSVKGIPVITMYPDKAEKCPIVFFVHGFEGNKTQGVELGYLLAQEGCFFVSLDAHLHGERSTPEFEAIFDPDNHIYPSNTGLDVYYSLFKIVVQTGKDVDYLVEHFAEDRRVDVERVGICGLSMGAFTTFYEAANNSKIKAAVPMIGFPSFGQRWEDVIAETSTYPRWSAQLKKVAAETKKRTEFMWDIDPDEGLKEFCPKPLLMISGDIDTDAPKWYCLKLYRELLPLYANHLEKLKFSVHDGVAHRVTSRMRKEACEWFQKHL